MRARFGSFYWLSVCLVLLIAALARFHDLDAQSLWNDEGNSLRLAQRSVSDLIDATGRDIHPPGYYLLLKGWIGLVGDSEFGLRALSAFEGLLAVAATLALGRALFGRGAGIVAGLLVALNSFAVYYSQETRMYAQLELLSVLSLWALVRWLSDPARWSWPLALAVINAAGLYTQYSYGFTLLAQGAAFGLWLLWRRFDSPARRALATYASLNGLTLLLFLPWLPTAYDQITGWPRTGIDIALDEQLRTVFTWITYGSTAGAIGWLRLIWPSLLILMALAWPDDRPHRLPNAWRSGVPLLWGGIVIAALFVSGAYREANLKFLLPAQIAAALLIGAGVVSILNGRGEFETRPGRVLGPPLQHRFVPARRLLAAVPLIVLLAGQKSALDALYTDPDYARDDYRGIAAAVRADPRPGDAIILDAPNQAEVFSYYYDGPAPVYELPRGLGGDDAQTRAEVLAVIGQHTRIFVLFWGEEERDPRRVVQATLDASAYPIGSRWVGHVRLAEYHVLGQPPDVPQTLLGAQVGDHITLEGYALSCESTAPGSVIGVTLFWQADIPLETRYKVFVQLLGPDGRLIGQHDSEPANNLAPTTTWIPGQTVIDLHGLVVPPDLPPGAYPIIAGLYDPAAPLDRLPVSVDGKTVGDHVVLPPLAID